MVGVRLLRNGVKRNIYVTIYRLQDMVAKKMVVQNYKNLYVHVDPHLCSDMIFKRVHQTSEMLGTCRCTENKA